MGTRRHVAMLVTTSTMEGTASEKRAAQLSAYLQGMQLRCSPWLTGRVNGVSTLTVLPSGSNMGWAEQKRHAEKLELVKKWLDEYGRSECGNSYFDWVEVQYGDEAPLLADVPAEWEPTGTRVVSHSDEGFRRALHSPDERSRQGLDEEE